MTNIIPQLEAILFVASTPLSLRRLAKSLEVTEGDIAQTLQELSEKYNHGTSGIHILISGEAVQMVSNPGFKDLVEQFTKSEVTGELTRAQLETLTVIAYRSPVTRPELEQIRGVNCAIILRNLLLRGLITEEENKESLLPVYQLSIDCLRLLGLTNINELPNFAELHAHENIERVLTEKQGNI